MRSVNVEKTSTLDPAPARKLGNTSAPPPRPSPPVKDPLLEAINAFPSHLAAAIRQIPAPVIAPRPPGAWVIDVNRDKEGKMSQMIANFHETNTK